MQVKLINVRLSFPDLFKPKSVQGSEPKYAASFLLNKEDDAEQIIKLRAAMKIVMDEKFGDKPPKGLKACLHEGAEKDYDGYGPESMYITASSTNRPTVIDRDRSPLTADDNRPYAGCFVNAVIRLWAQDNQFGKRINAQLQGVQFAEEGDAFGAPPFNAEEHFEVIGNRSAPRTTEVTDDEEEEIPF